MNTRSLTPLLVLLFALGPARVVAHCQIPCGIYDDPARFTAMEEDVTTIEKSMASIRELSSETPPNWNQIVRWVQNKETHADKLMETVTHYFLAQRVKPADPADEEAYTAYVSDLTLLHSMVLHAMKAKQTTDQEHVDRLQSLIQEFKSSYLGRHRH